MNITWITGRDLKSDLASTTEIGIIKGMIKENMSINIFSTTINMEKNNFTHHRFKKIRIKGMETFSGGFFLRSEFKKNHSMIKIADCIIIDWCYVPSLRNELKRMGRPWFIVDRGPPVYSSFLTKIQKRIWKKAWIIASKEANGGFVVSEKHKRLVQRIDSIIEPHILNAGTDLDNFSKTEKDIKECVLIAYCGRIDKNRGLESITELSKNLEREMIVHEIHVMGEGDYENEIKKISKDSGSIIYHGKISRKEVYVKLQKMHFGIMPMPDKTVWRTASPIKLVEYMASGLLTIGQDHSGNRISEDEAWSFLIEGEKWAEKTPQLIKNIMHGGRYRELSASSRKAAEEYDWQIITQKMIKYIRKNVNKNK